MLPDEKGATAAGFLRRAVAWFKAHGDRASSGSSLTTAPVTAPAAHAEACEELGLRHLFTRPYRPRTNGKAERFIQTLTNRWAYGAIYGSSAERTAALSGWLTHSHSDTGSSQHRAQEARRNNVLGNYT